MRHAKYALALLIAINASAQAQAQAQSQLQVNLPGSTTVNQPAIPTAATPRPAPANASQPNPETPGNLARGAIDAVLTPSALPSRRAPVQTIPTLPPENSSPPTLTDLKSLSPSSGSKKSSVTEIRGDALRDAARAFGTQGGLARRTWEINNLLRAQENSLDRVFDFRAILYKTPGSTYLLPPIISEAEAALVISSDQQTSQEAERVFSVLKTAVLSPTAPDWRAYLVRIWPIPKPPTDLLRPKDEDERRLWSGWIEEGWALGVRQAEEEFEINISLLERDFVGMARYSSLLANGMVQPPTIASSDRDIDSDGGRNMRLNQRMVRIVNPGGLNDRPETWTPVTIRQIDEMTAIPNRPVVTRENLPPRSNTQPSSQTQTPPAASQIRELPRQLTPPRQ